MEQTDIHRASVASYHLRRTNIRPHTVVPTMTHTENISPYFRTEMTKLLHAVLSNMFLGKNYLT